MSHQAPHGRPDEPVAVGILLLLLLKAPVRATVLFLLLAHRGGLLLLCAGKL